VREIRTPGSMSGEEKRSDGLLGEHGNERRRALLAPPVLHATALLLDSTGRVATRTIGTPRVRPGKALTDDRLSGYGPKRARSGKYWPHPGDLGLNAPAKI
jgi:hypothetical protein